MPLLIGEDWTGNRAKREGSDMQHKVGDGVELVTAAWRTEPSVHGPPALPIELNDGPAVFTKTRLVLFPLLGSQQQMKKN